jgi:hypothetical protein
MTRGRCGSLRLHRNGLAPSTFRRSPGAPVHHINNAKSKIRSRVEHVFAEQKDRMGLFIRTIGIARATTKIGTDRDRPSNDQDRNGQSGLHFSDPARSAALQCQ